MFTIIFRSFLLLIFAIPLFSAPALQSLTSTKGATIQAVVLKVAGDQVFLRRADGVSFQVSLSLFDAASRAKIVGDGNPTESAPVGPLAEPEISFEKIKTSIINNPSSALPITL